MILPTMLLSLGLLAPQESAPQPGPAAPEDPAVAPDSDGAEVTAEGLRQRIKDMRMNLLLGGDQVRQAEREAIDFYGQKSRHVDSRIDDVETELVALRASYDVVLERALSASGTAAGEEALREAQPIRAQIGALEGEAEDLAGRRARLSELVASVQDRDRDRRRLVDQIESAAVLPDGLGVPMGGIGLAPPPIASEASAPLADEGLLNDLLRRDPRRARTLLFSADPVGYWERFPLRPPAGALREALRFPLPDPPQQRAASAR